MYRRVLAAAGRKLICPRALHLHTIPDHHLATGAERCRTLESRVGWTNQVVQRTAARGVLQCRCSIIDMRTPADQRQLKEASPDGLLSKSGLQLWSPSTAWLAQKLQVIDSGQPRQRACGGGMR